MATKNTITDLYNHLFAQLERLGDEDIKEEDLKREIKRAEALSQVSQTIINAAKVQVEFIDKAGTPQENGQFFNPKQING